jgi:hypothetical protein
VTWGRRALLLVAATVAVLLAGPPAGAHNQRTAFLGDYGPYDVVASVRDRDQPGQDGVLLEMVVRTAGERAPVDDATVVVTGEGGGTDVGPLPVDQYGNVYRVVLPGNEVDVWDVEVELAGPPGTTTLSEEVPGPRTLHGSSLLTSDSSPTGGWLAFAGLTLLGLALVGLTPWWRPAMWASALVLIATCAVTAVQVWTAPTTDAAERVALVPVAVLVVVLAAGLVLSRRRDDARALVFAGGAGLAVLVGWANRAALTASSTDTVLSPTATRAVAALALGLGGGLALMVVVLSVRRSRSPVADARAATS